MICGTEAARIRVEREKVALPTFTLLGSAEKLKSSHFCRGRRDRESARRSSEMERKVVAVCGVVGFLAVLSAATGFAAEATRIKGDRVQYLTDNACLLPSSPAMPLGLTAAMALLVAHLIINASTGCICCRRTPHLSNSNWKVAVICFLLSWFAFMMAFLLLLTGAALNNDHEDGSMYLGYYFCYVVKPGVFAGGAVLSLASLVLGLVYYLSVKAAGINPSGGIISLVQPQIPAQTSSQDPVFVHHDTYMRRQFT